MTKQEYLDTVLMTEDRGWLDHSDISEIASKAWDAAVEQTYKWLAENAVNYTISSRGMFLTALLDDYKKAMEGKK